MAKPTVDALVDAFTTMTQSELGDFRTQFEEIFGVSGDTATPAVVTTTAVDEVEEQTAFTVTLVSAGEQKIKVIKAIRELSLGLGLKEAKDVADKAPTVLMTDVTRDRADEATLKLRTVGATVDIA